MAFFSGPSASVSVGGTARSMGKWEVNINADLPDVSNFVDGQYRINLSGLIDADITIRGPMNTGGAAIAAGTTYEFVLTVGGGVSFTVTARVERVSPSQDIYGKAEIVVSAKSTGSFTPSIEVG
jgi:hypothetical protein